MKKNYCPLPFGHINVNTRGDYMICCKHTVPLEQRQNIRSTSLNDWLTNDYLEQVRSNFEKDQRHPGCSECWRSEDAGFQSLRQKTIKEYKILGLKDTQSQLVNVEIDLSNVCNLACMMCRSENSSKILNEERLLYKTNLTQHEFDWNDHAYENIQRLFDMDVKLVTFSGGEPFFNKKLFRILNDLDPVQVSRTMLHFNTNATCWNAKWAEVLSKFRSIRFMIGVDGTADTYEYIRWPGVWSEVSKNIQEMSRAPNVKILINCTVQNLNIGRLGDVYDWCQTQKIWLQLYRLQRPTYLGITNLIPELKNKAIDHLKSCLPQINHDHVREFFQSCIHDLDRSNQEEFDATLWQEFLDTMNLKQSLRHNDWQQLWQT